MLFAKLYKTFVQKIYLATGAVLTTTTILWPPWTLGLPG